MLLCACLIFQVYDHPQANYKFVIVGAFGYLLFKVEQEGWAKGIGRLIWNLGCHTVILLYIKVKDYF